MTDQGNEVAFCTSLSLHDVAFYVDPAVAVDVEVRFPYHGTCSNSATTVKDTCETNGGTWDTPVVKREENVVPNNLAADRTVTVSPD